MKIKLGPLALVYNGSGRFLERDAEARRLVFEARATTGGATAPPPPGHRVLGRQRVRDRRRAAHRPGLHRPAGPVRQRGDLRRQRQAARPVRQLCVRPVRRGPRGPGAEDDGRGRRAGGGGRRAVGGVGRATTWDDGQDAEDERADRRDGGGRPADGDGRRRRREAARPRRPTGRPRRSRSRPPSRSPPPYRYTPPSDLSQADVSGGHLVGTVLRRYGPRSGSCPWWWSS